MEMQGEMGKGDGGREEEESGLRMKTGWLLVECTS